MLQSDEKEKASVSDKPAGNAELLKKLKPFGLGDGIGERELGDAGRF
jgi:hypothetical protein